MNIAIFAPFHLMPKVRNHMDSARSQDLLGDGVDVAFSYVKPVFLTRERLEAIGIPLENLVDRYKIYIGSDVDSVTPSHDGVEVPSTVLDDFEAFRINVLSVIHSILDMYKEDVAEEGDVSTEE